MFSRCLIQHYFTIQLVTFLFNICCGTLHEFNAMYLPPHFSACFIFPRYFFPYLMFPHVSYFSRAFFHILYSLHIFPTFHVSSVYFCFADATPCNSSFISVSFHFHLPAEIETTRTFISQSDACGKRISSGTLFSHNRHIDPKARQPKLMVIATTFDHCYFILASTAYLSQYHKQNHKLYSR